jgi:hypothetical protein
MFEKALLKMANVMFRQYLATIRSHKIRYIFLRLLDLMFPEVGSQTVSEGNSTELETNVSGWLDPKCD